MIKKRWATQYFAFWGGRPSQPPPPAPDRWGILRPSGARGPGPRVWLTGLCKLRQTFGPFCALRVWQKFPAFQFETGFPRVALNNLGTKSGATSFALGKSCKVCKHLPG